MSITPVIDPATLTPAGRVNKPHGIKGELSVTFMEELEELDPALLSCLVMERDGIPVPFFMQSVRPRTGATWLIKLEGVDSDAEARTFNGASVMVLESELQNALPEPDDDDEYDAGQDGFYAADLIGMSVTADGRPLGNVTAIDDSTANVLMVITDTSCTPPREHLVPLAPEFFTEVDPEAATITLSLPDGLIQN